jgi:hypothetical protein
MKIIITEDQYNDLKFRRRGIDLQKIRDMIEDQVEIQDPQNFEDAEEYSYFCVRQAICHYFKDCDDYDYDDDDDWDDEEEDDDDDNNIHPELSFQMRVELENLMDDEFDEYLKSLWEEYHQNYSEENGIIEENDFVDSSVDAFKKLLSMLGDTFKQKETNKSTSTPLKKDTYVGPKGVLGSEWKSCKAWRSKGGLAGWSENVDVDKSSSQFKITYKGPSSGLSIAHASNGRDTIHQLFNILICELNQFLYEGNLKPNINNIKTEGGKSGKNSTLTITVPLEHSEDTYQLDRRGGWGHDPGSSKMASKCAEIESKGGECFGPVKNVTQAQFGKITEYFITYTI